MACADDNMGCKVTACDNIVSLWRLWSSAPDSARMRILRLRGVLLVLLVVLAVVVAVLLVVVVVGLGNDADAVATVAVAADVGSLLLAGDDAVVVVVVDAVALAVGGGFDDSCFFFRPGLRPRLAPGGLRCCGVWRDGDGGKGSSSTGSPLRRLTVNVLGSSSV